MGLLLFAGDFGGVLARLGEYVGEGFLDGGAVWGGLGVDGCVGLDGDFQGGGLEACPARQEQREKGDVGV